MRTKELVRPYRGRFALIVLLYALGSVMGLAPLMAAMEIGRAFLSDGPTDGHHVWRAVMFGAGGLVLGVVLIAAAATSGHVLDGTVQLDLRRRLAMKLSRVQLGRLVERRTGDLTKAIGDDVSTVHPFIAHAPGELVSAFVVPIGVAVYLFTVDWRMTLITLIPVALAIVFVPAMMTPPRLREQEEFDEAMGHVTSAVIEFVEGIAVVKTFGAPGRAHQRFRTATDAFVTVFTRWVRGISRPAAAMQFVLSPAFVLLVVFIGGATLIVTESIDAVDLLPFLFLGMGLTAPVAALGHGFDDLVAARRCARAHRRGARHPVDGRTTSTRDSRGASGGVPWCSCGIRRPRGAHRNRPGSRTRYDDSTDRALGQWQIHADRVASQVRGSDRGRHPARRSRHTRTQ
ncbi:ABC transporter transmembrane domain-containing protein [Gordonia humi]|uniref:ABC transporter transmembrane domain-containing protein n=1 Tax=Gordonia humi TaxID=686429 RepID=UPI0036240C9E